MRVRHFENGAIGAWILFALVIAAVSLAIPNRSLIPLYATATNDFWAGANDRWDYFYLPSSRIIFTPIAALGHRAGGVLWELIAVLLLSLAAWQWSRILVDPRAKSA